MSAESQYLLESRLKNLEARRLEYLSDLDAVFLGWLNASADDIWRRIEVIDHEKVAIQAKIRSAKIFSSKGCGAYITN